MPIIDFEIDPKTGELKSHVQGVKGKACEGIEKLLAELMGAPTDSHNTAEYYEQPVQRTIRQEQGQGR